MTMIMMIGAAAGKRNSMSSMVRLRRSITCSSSPIVWVLQEAVRRAPPPLPPTTTITTQNHHHSQPIRIARRYISTQTLVALQPDRGSGSGGGPPTLLPPHMKHYYKRPGQQVPPHKKKLNVNNSSSGEKFTNRLSRYGKEVYLQETGHVVLPSSSSSSSNLLHGSKVATSSTLSAAATTTKSTTTTINTTPQHATLPSAVPAVHNHASAAPSFRIIRLNYSGDYETVNLPLSDVLRSASIYARDLFALNLTSRQEQRHHTAVGTASSAVSRYKASQSIPAVVTPRENICLLSFGAIRAVVGLHDIYIFDAHNPLVKEFAKELADIYRMSANSSAASNSSITASAEPDELIFLEKALQDTVESFQRRLRLFEPIVDNFSDKVSNEVYSDTGVHQLVPLKDSLQSFEIQVKQSLECLTGLLNDDDEMLALLLTEQAQAKQTGQAVDFSRHEHVELLIGVYARQLNNILMEINFFQSRIQSKQEFVALALAGYRNRMIRMNVHIAIAGLSLGFGTTVAGFFGMNLVNGLETSPTAFMTVISLSGLGATVIAAGAFSYLSGRTMRERAKQRLEEIETLTCALGDMAALDFTIKQLVQKGLALDKESFRATLRRARESKKITDAEVDLLFDIFDRLKDGHIRGDDFDAAAQQQSLIQQQKWEQQYFNAKL